MWHSTELVSNVLSASMLLMDWAETQKNWFLSWLDFSFFFCLMRRPCHNRKVEICIEPWNCLFTSCFLQCQKKKEYFVIFRQNHTIFNNVLLIYVSNACAAATMVLELLNSTPAIAARTLFSGALQRWVGWLLRPFKAVLRPLKLIYRLNFTESKVYLTFD